MRGYLKGANLGAIVRGHRRMVAAIKARTAEPEPEPCEHPDHKKQTKHAEHCPSHPAPKVVEPTEHPFLTWAKRIGGTIGVLVLLWPLVGAWLPTTVSVTGLLWVLAALVAGQAEPEAEAAPRQPEAATVEQADGDGEYIDLEPPAPVLYALIRHVAATSDQGTAAHLDDVLAEGQKRGLFGDWEKADLKAHLTQDLGLPVEELKLKFRRRQRVRLGVWLRDLPEADLAPVPAVLQKTA